MTLIPFNQDLNRLMLKATNVKARKSYKVTWGSESKTLHRRPTRRAASTWPPNSPATPSAKPSPKWTPPSPPSRPTRPNKSKQIFRSPEAKTDMEAVAARTEQDRAPLAEAIQSAFTPVTHTIKIEMVE